MSVLATSEAAVAIVPSPPATRIRFVPCSMACLSRCSSWAGSTTSRGKPAVVSALRAASAFPHLELRNAFNFDPRVGAGAGCVAGIGGKRGEGRGKREEGRGKGKGKAAL